MKTAAELRKELIAAEERERLALKAKKDATPPNFEFWVTPAQHASNGQYIYGKTYDPTCYLYTIERRIVNKEAAKAAGWDETDLKEGSATYVYNTVTRRIVCAVGGGTIYISANKPFGTEDFADDAAFYAIGTYLAEYPAGGEITWIYDQYRAERRKSISTNGDKTKA